MKIVCPHCGFSREVPDGQVPDRPVKVTCPKCQQGFAFDKTAVGAAAAADLAGASLPTTAAGEKTTTCPGCGLVQPAGDTCGGCGLIYAKWAARRDVREEVGEVKPPLAGAPPVHDFRVICNACGAVQPPAGQCINCGAILVAAATKLEPRNFAGFWVRLVAYLIDAAILGIVQFVISLALGFAGGSLTDNGGNMAMAMISALCGMVISIAYAVFFTGYNGQTPGKMALRIQVVRCDGTPMTYGRAFLREVIGKFASGIILGIGYLMVAFDRNKQGLHDRIAGTYVIKL